MEKIDNKMLLLLIKKISHFDNDKTSKLAKKLVIDCGEAENLVTAILNAVTIPSDTNFLHLSSIGASDGQIEIIKKTLTRPEKPTKPDKREVCKNDMNADELYRNKLEIVTNGFVTYGCKVSNESGTSQENREYTFKLFLKNEFGQMTNFNLNEEELKTLFCSLNTIQAEWDDLNHKL